jgi:hypothetical protein
MGERLGRVVGGGADHLHLLREQTKQQFRQDMVTAQEATEEGDAHFSGRPGRVVDGRLVGGEPGLIAQEEGHCIHIRCVAVQRATNCGRQEGVPRALPDNNPARSGKMAKALARAMFSAL